MRLPAFAVPLLLAAAMGGCLEGGPGEGASTSGTTTPAADGFGRVSGLVVDEEFLPVSGAEVAIRVHGLSARSNAQGGFALAGVPPGVHVLEVLAVGYEAVQRTIAVAAEEPLDGLEFVLAALEKPLEPYSRVLPHASFISCSFGLGSLYGTYYTQFCGWDPNNQPAFIFPVDVSAGLVAVVLEMQWTPTTGLDGEELRQALWNNIECVGIRCQPEKFDEDVYGEAQGPSPLKKVYGSLETPLRKGLNTTGPDTLVAIALIKKSDAPSAVFQQPVTHYVTVFYNSEPDQDYTALAG